MDKYTLYMSLLDAYAKAYPTKTKQQHQKDVNSVWNSLKKDKNCATLVSEKVLQYKEHSLKTKSGLLSFWKTTSSNKSLSQTRTVASNNVNSQEISKDILNISNSFEEVELDSHVPDGNISKGNKDSIHNAVKTPAQEKLQLEVNCLTADIAALSKRKRGGLMTDDLQKDLQKKRLQLSSVQTKLCVKRRDMLRKRKSRRRFKEKLSKLCEINPDIKKELKVTFEICRNFLRKQKHGSIREHTGRPRLEEEQPELLKTIIEIAIHGSSSHEKRREDMFRSVKTLKELQEKLNEIGFQISRSATYLRLLPRRSNTHEGKRHITTVPVRLCRAQNNHHEQHSDTAFTTASIHSLEAIASLLGPQQVAFISQDDKARVPIGVTAANKQSPLLMHVEYRIKLADHDWVKANKHKLIPSVYAGIKITENMLGDKSAVGYSGPTFIAIRSGKHSSSNALSHARDLNYLFDNVPEFDELLKYQSENGPVVKPVLIIISDGGPDENPRYEKVIRSAIHHFIMRDLDALFVATNAPGRSCFNRVERRMAPLSKDLCGLVLPHDNFGNHLNNQNETIDVELEKKNFAKAGEILADIWSQNIIDNHPTVARYVNESESEINEEDLIVKDSEWWNKHIEFGQYFLQIVKCDDLNCCKPKRSSLFTVLKNGRIPPPLPLISTERELMTPETNFEKLKVGQFSSLFLNVALRDSFELKNFDIFCPSIQSKIASRTCKDCSKYFSAAKFLKEHEKLHKKKSQAITEIDSRKIRPKRIAAIRAREALAIIDYDDDMEDAEWHHQEDLDLDGVNIPDVTIDHGNLVIPLEAHLNNEWLETL